MGWLKTSNGMKCGYGCLGPGSPGQLTMGQGDSLDESAGCNLCVARRATVKWPYFCPARVIVLLDQWFSKWGNFAPTMGYLALSGDIFGWHAISIQWVEARVETAKYPIMHKIDPILTP